MRNLFADIPAELPEECLETLLETGSVRIERIISRGHASPPDDWYDQDQSEWVVVLRGRAELVFEGDEQPLAMEPGDAVHIPAHRKHRVQWTAADEPTIWLAVFYDSEA